MSSCARPSDEGVLHNHPAALRRPQAGYTVTLNVSEVVAASRSNAVTPLRLATPNRLNSREHGGRPDVEARVGRRGFAPCTARIDEAHGRKSFRAYCHRTQLVYVFGRVTGFGPIRCITTTVRFATHRTRSCANAENGSSAGGAPLLASTTVTLRFKRAHDTRQPCRNVASVSSDTGLLKPRRRTEHCGGCGSLHLGCGAMNAVSGAFPRPDHDLEPAQPRTMRMSGPRQRQSWRRRSSGVEPRVQSQIIVGRVFTPQTARIAMDDLSDGPKKCVRRLWQRYEEKH